MVLVHSSRNEGIQKGIADYPDRRVTPESPNSQRQPISPALYRKPPTCNTLKSTDKSDILNLLAALHDEGHQITFIWCRSHCMVVGNEMADEQAQKGASSNQEDIQHNYDSAKATIRHTTRGRKSPMKEFAECMA